MSEPPPRCGATGNPCGTDTWPADRPCPCRECQRWLCGELDAARAERDRLGDVLMRAAAEMARESHGSFLHETADALLRHSRQLRAALAGPPPAGEG